MINETPCAAKLLIIVIICAIAIIGPAQAKGAEVRAPFGLSWGMTPAMLKESPNCRPQDDLVICEVYTVPKPLSAARVYVLIFTPVKGLVKVNYYSKAFENDFYGTVGKTRFDRLMKILVKKYPTAQYNDYRVMFAEVFRAPDEFYECLSYLGCGIYAWELVMPKNRVLLSLAGARRGAGYIKLSYESPEWRELTIKSNDISSFLKKSEV